MSNADSSSEDVNTDDSTEKQIITFEDADPENPYNWSRAKKLWIVLLGTLTTLNSTVASSLPSGASPQLQQHFNVNVEEQLVLPNSVYLIGYILGPFVFAPLSETYGRRFIMLGTFLAFTIFVMATALAPNWAAFNIFRLLSGVFGSTPISVTGGLFADIYSNPAYRGLAMAWYLAVASAGPVFAPIPAGYLAEFVGWRWPFWFGLILAGVCIPPLLFLPETFGPAILCRKARHLRKKQPGCNLYAPIELRHVDFRELATKVLVRPIYMLVTEPIVTACCMYLSLIYAVIFILFQAFPEIYPPIYGFNQGETGLAFLPIGIGSFAALPICIWWDYMLRTNKAKGKPWASKEEFQRLPLACFGGPLFTAGMFWIGWAARRDVHWIVPMLGGLPLGIGFVLVFNALFNYIVDSYKIYSASALGATSISRSTFGVVLPFAAKPMYDTLGVAWACSLLGFLSLLMCLIPYTFIRWGPRLRAASPMCQELARQAEAAKQPASDEKLASNADKA